MPKRMCKACPYRKGTEKNLLMDKILPKIDKDIEEGLLPNAPHACHSMTDEMIPTDKEHECAGHRILLLRRKNEKINDDQ